MLQCNRVKSELLKLGDDKGARKLNKLDIMVARFMAKRQVLVAQRSAWSRWRQVSFARDESGSHQRVIALRDRK